MYSLYRPSAVPLLLRKPCCSSSNCASYHVLLRSKIMITRILLKIEPTCIPPEKKEIIDLLRRLKNRKFTNDLQAIYLKTAIESNGCRSSLAGGRKRSTGQASSCNSSNCKTCPDLLHSLDFSSNVTGRTFSAVNVSIQEIHCKLQNFIYLLTCLCCNIQYVGETIIPMHSRMNIHRKGKTGCEIAINHFTNVCPGAFLFVSLKSFLVTDTKMGKETKKCINIVLKEKIFG